MNDRGHRPSWRWTFAVAVVALAATLPTTGDLGLTWDEPAYRYSQVVSAQWWGRLFEARDSGAFRALFEPDALLYYWPYGRHGINFHPPLAGQLSALTHALFGGVVRDIPARRLASVLEFAATIVVLHRVLARRYGPSAGLAAAGALLTMPRVFGHGQIAGTDTPGMLLWTLAAVAAWKGLAEPGARPWRVAFGVLLGLCFLVKMAAVMVLLPVFGWLALTRLPRSLGRGGRAAWIDGGVTTAALLAPMVVALIELLRLAALLPEPQVTNLFVHRPPGRLPGAIFLAPASLWMARRLVARLARSSATWGVERPALELWWSTLAFAPAVGWLGNPAWWREAMPRMAHYAMLTVDREGALPDIRIYYLGETYLFSLPWHNGWVLIAATVPAATLLAGAVGLAFAARSLPSDRFPAYLVVHFAALPVLRMLPTPAHDGVRLMLPAFPFLAALAGLGARWLGDGLAAGMRRRGRPVPFRAGVAGVVVGWSAIQLILIHPYELSYYNRFVGGPAGAWRRGFELTYWYDAFNPGALQDINALDGLDGQHIERVNDLAQDGTFVDLQSLGELRSDLPLSTPSREGFAARWLLTHDSKADGQAKAIFAMRPLYASRPAQLGGVRVASVVGPGAAARGRALWLLAGDERPPTEVRAPLPGWLRAVAPWLGRFWGEGLARPDRSTTYEPIFDWAARDPDSLRRAAEALADDPSPTDAEAERLLEVLERHDEPARRRFYAYDLLVRRPRAVVEAAEILIRRPGDVRLVLDAPGLLPDRRRRGHLDDPDR